jgi:hypothetical protein
VVVAVGIRGLLVYAGRGDLFFLCCWTLPYSNMLGRF